MKTSVTFADELYNILRAQNFKQFYFLSCALLSSTEKFDYESFKCHAAFTLLLLYHRLAKMCDAACVHWSLMMSLVSRHLLQRSPASDADRSETVEDDRTFPTLTETGRERCVCHERAQQRE